MSLPNNIKTAFATDTNVGGKCYYKHVKNVGGTIR